MFFFKDWWSTLNMEEQVFWSLAVVFTLLSIIQSILNLTGADFYSEKSPALASSRWSSRYFNATNLLSFFTFFSWTTIIVLNLNGTLAYAIIIGILISFLVVTLLVLLLYTEEKILNLEETLNHTAKVNQSIPPCKNGLGSIQLELRGNVLELVAMTEGNALPQGADVKVVRVIEGGTLLVEPIRGTLNNSSQMKER